VSRSAGSRSGPGLARACRCPRPIPYQDFGEWAGCAKCGHWLAAEIATALGSVADDRRISGQERPGAFPPPGGRGPESPGRELARDRARHRGDGPPPSPHAALGSGPDLSGQETRALTLLMGAGEEDE